MYSEISLIGKEFSVDNAHSYSLSIEISKENIIFAVYDIENNKFLALEANTIIRNFNDEVFCESIYELIINSKLYHIAYKHIKVFINTPKYTLVPNELHDLLPGKNILEYNHFIDSVETPLEFNIDELNLNVIYAVSTNLRSLILDKINFRNIPRFYSTNASFIKIILNQFKNNNAILLFANIHVNNMDLLVIDNKNILLSNSFKIVAKEDVLYHILFVAEQLNLNPETFSLMVSGNINKDDETINLLSKYITTVKLLERNANYTYSEELDTIPQHYHYQILNNNL